MVTNVYTTYVNYIENNFEFSVEGENESVCEI